MSSAPAHPVHASCVYLRIAQFESLTVTEQAARKERMEAGARAALGQVVTADRVVLDAEDGLAVIVFGEPAHAMDVAMLLHARPEAEVQAGLNYGPLALTSPGSDGRVFGDGISQAAAAARFAPVDKLLVTDTFARALQASAPDRAVELVPAGEFTDTRVRQHSFHTPDVLRRGSRRRRLAIFAIGGSVLILLLGVVGRDIYQPLFQSRPAVVRLDIKPRGEVFVDGNSVGRVPPLTQIEVAPGKRRITIRNAGARAYEATIDLAPGQQFTITHAFPPPPPQKPDLWRDLKRKFGS